MPTRQPLDTQALVLMFFFCLCLGLQQVVLKAAAKDIAPVMQLALRSGISALLICFYMRWRHEKFSHLDETWKPGLAAGVLFTMEYLLLGEALRFTTASHAVVFLYTSPIFAALILHFKVRTERMSAIQWVGITLAFAGIAVAFYGHPAPGAAMLPSQLWGDALALLAGLSWGLTTVVIRTSRLADAPAKQTLLYQLSTGFVLLLLGAVVTGQAAFKPTALALGSLAFQSIVIAFIAFLTWFWLLRRYLASRLGVLSFMTPIFGVILGAWLLDERIEHSFMLGSLLVLAGIVIVSGQEWLKQTIERRKRQQNQI